MPKLLKFHIKETSEYRLSKSSLYFVFFFFRLNRKKKNATNLSYTIYQIYSKLGSVGFLQDF